MRRAVSDWVTTVVQSQGAVAPVLEVGSRNVNGTVRPLFPQAGYLGIDLVDGPGVDLVADILKVGDRFNAQFSTVVCCETLEHVKEPWAAIDTMALALRPGGLLIVTWCFAFPLHDAEIDKGQSGDYGRTTPSGLDYLLRRAGLVDVVIATEGVGRPRNSPPTEQDWQYPVGVFGHGRRPA